jgi:hypothetical protein
MIENKEDFKWVKIAFRLEKDSDDYPPADWEYLWAKQVESDLYEIDSIPFFVKSIAVGDRVKASKVDKELVFDHVVTFSGHTTLRVVVHDVSRMQYFRDELVKLGCKSELSHIPGLLAVNVPPEIDYSIIRNFLDREEDAKSLGYEEAALGQKS